MKLVELVERESNDTLNANDLQEIKQMQQNILQQNTLFETQLDSVKKDLDSVENDLDSVENGIKNITYQDGIFQGM